MKWFFSLSAVTVALLLSLLMVVPCLAQTREVQTIRCGTNVVRVGAAPFELVQNCGEPDQKDFVEAKLSTVEKWTYNCGSQRFIKIITMRGGKVWKIEEGVRGSGPNRCQ